MILQRITLCLNNYATLDLTLLQTTTTAINSQVYKFIHGQVSVATSRHAFRRVRRALDMNKLDKKNRPRYVLGGCKILQVVLNLRQRCKVCIVIMYFRTLSTNCYEIIRSYYDRNVVYDLKHKIHRFINSNRYFSFVFSIQH